MNQFHCWFLVKLIPLYFSPGGRIHKRSFLTPPPPPLSLSPTLLNLLLDRQKSRKMGFYFLEKSRKMAGFYCWEKSRKMGFYCVEKSRKMGFYCLEQFRLRPPHSSSSLPVERLKYCMYSIAVEIRKTGYHHVNDLTSIVRGHMQSKVGRCSVLFD